MKKYTKKSINRSERMNEDGCMDYIPNSNKNGENRNKKIKTHGLW